MKVLVIKQLFDPEPTAKALDFARELVRRGHEVEVLTSFPSYPLGRVYDGWRQRAVLRQVREGVRIVRVPIYPYHGPSAVRRAANYISFALSATAGLPRTSRPDVAFVYQGAATVLVPAILQRAVRGVPYVLDVNDLWPDTLSETRFVRSAGVLRLVDGLCRMGYARAGAITASTPGIRDALIDRGADPQAVVVAPNWSRDAPSTDVAELPAPCGRRRVLFAGNVGSAQGLETLVSAAVDEAGEPLVDVVVLGDGIELPRLRDRVRAAGLSNVHFLGRVPKKDVPAYLNAADVLFASLVPRPLFRITVPSKVPTYLANGKPVIYGGEGDARRIVEASRAGWTFDPGDVAALRQVFAEVRRSSDDQLARLGARGRAYYSEHLSMERSVDIIEAALRRAAA